MSNRVRISELSAFPDPYANDDNLLPVFAFDNTYKLPVSALTTQIDLTANITNLNPGAEGYVFIDADPAIRNKFNLEFGIPQGLSGVSPQLTAIASSTSNSFPTVEVFGTVENPVFSFQIPSGEAGTPGTAGTTPSISAVINAIEENEDAFVVRSGTDEDPILNFYIPKGPRGNPGIGINLKGRRATKADLLAVVSPSAGDAWFVNADESFTPPQSSVFYVWGEDTDNVSRWLSGGALQGPSGANGINASIVQVSAVSGSQVAVENFGTTTNARFKFTIPTGAKGEPGIPGDWTSPQKIKVLSNTANYTLTGTDAGSLIIINTPSSFVSTFNLIVPTTAGNFLSGQKVDIVRTGTAQVSCVAASGATINGTPGLKLRDQYSSASCIYYDTNKWLVVGDLDV